MVNLIRKILPAFLQNRVLRTWLHVERHLPMAIRSIFWNDWCLFGKPQLGYLEAHVVDHCNLNCRRCSHFSPLAQPHFTDPSDFARDLARLAELFKNIRVIRLMGGEPLLHPEVGRFLSSARGIFPHSRIHLVTNGLLLRQMPADFWLCCRKSRTVIDLTVYPPILPILDEIRGLCGRERVGLRESPNNAFCVRMDLEGCSAPKSAFSNCRNLFYCPVLKEGRLHVCATSAYVGYFNSRYGANLPQDEGVNLGDPGLSGRRVLRELNKSVALCRFCSLKTHTAPWSNSSPEKLDWDIRSAQK